MGIGSFVIQSSTKIKKSLDSIQFPSYKIGTSIVTFEHMSEVQRRKIFYRKGRTGHLR